LRNCCDFVAQIRLLSDRPAKLLAIVGADCVGRLDYGVLINVQQTGWVIDGSQISGSVPVFLFMGSEMINRSMMNFLVEDLLCAGILLSLCAVIILGPQPASSELTSSESAVRTRASAVEESRYSISLETNHQASMKFPNQ
jgi:hypothetical protein